MNNPFTASEVRKWADALMVRAAPTLSDMLHAYADRLDADEKAVPVAVVKDSDALYTGWLSWTGESLSPETKLYTHPAPADAERLAEALQPFANLLQPHHASIPDDRPIYGINKAEITAGDLRRANEALTAHSAQAQPKNVSFVRETWTEDADGDRPNLCTICGKPLRYGTRHTACAIAQAQPPAASVPDGLVDALRHQRQIDEDGTEVGVSRQAVYEAANILAMLAEQESRNG